MGPLSLKDTSMWRGKLTPDPAFWVNKPIKTILWDVRSKTIQAGFQMDLNELRRNKDLKTLISQLKFLNGDILKTQLNIIDGRVKIDQFTFSSSEIDFEKLQSLA